MGVGVTGFCLSLQNVEHKCPLICGYKLNCGLHRCQEPCHRGNCEPCWQSSESHFLRSNSATFMSSLEVPNLLFLHHLCILYGFTVCLALMNQLISWTCGVMIPSVCRFRRAGVSLWAHCPVPAHLLWHQATRVQKHVHKKTRVRPPRWNKTIYFTLLYCSVLRGAGRFAKCLD